MRTLPARFREFLTHVKLGCKRSGILTLKMSTEDSLHCHARQAALELQAAAEQAQMDLERIQAEAEAQRERLESVITQARQAQERLVNYTPAAGGDLMCPRCFIRLGAKSL